MPELSSNLETRLTEFLDTGPPLKEMMHRIENWQLAHDAEHKKLEEEMRRDTASYGFRLKSLEASAGRGWAGAVRMALIIMLAVGSGYAVRAASIPSSPLQAH